MKISAIGIIFAILGLILIIYWATPISISLKGIVLFIGLVFLIFGWWLVIRKTRESGKEK